MGDANFDAFGDIINHESGIFGDSEPNIAGAGGGLKAHDTPKTLATPEGVVVEMQCRGCPRPLRITVEYPELYCVMRNLNPQEVLRYAPNQVSDVVPWGYSQNAWWPHCECRSCRTPALPMFTSREAATHLQNAKQMGWINPQGEAMMARLCDQVIAHKTGASQAQVPATNGQFQY